MTGFDAVIKTCIHKHSNQAGHFKPSFAYSRFYKSIKAVLKKKTCLRGPSLRKFTLFLMHLDLVSSVRWRRQRCLASVFVILAIMMIQLLCYSENSAHPLFSVLALKRRYIDTTEVGQREAQLRGNMSNVGNGTTLSECIKASPPALLLLCHE